MEAARAARVRASAAACRSSAGDARAARERAHVLVRSAEVDTARAARVRAPVADRAPLVDVGALHRRELLAVATTFGIFSDST